MYTVFLAVGYAESFIQRATVCFSLQVHDVFPFFVEMQWYALDCYVVTLARPECSSQATDQGQSRKHVGRKKMKADDEAGGDCKNQKMTRDDDDDDCGGDTEDSERHDAKLNRYFTSSMSC